MKGILYKYHHSRFYRLWKGFKHTHSESEISMIKGFVLQGALILVILSTVVVSCITK